MKTTLSSTQFALGTALLLIATTIAAPKAPAAIFSFGSSDFTTTPIFSSAQTFDFSIELADTIVPGQTYSNPAIVEIDYNVSGTLAAGTPSGFPAFALTRNIIGGDFYAQGSSFQFSVRADAELADGLQVDELAGTGLVFEFNARELGQTPGRYHPPVIRLNSDGTGLIQNSNNMGGENPATMMDVDVDFGEEYQTGLTFTPGGLTLATVPEPGVSGLGLITSCLIMSRRRRGSWIAQLDPKGSGTRQSSGVLREAA